MSFEHAATISLCGLTAAQAAYYRLGLQAPFPRRQTTEETSSYQRDDEAETTSNFFIYSASTSIGMYAAQMVRLSSQSTGAKAKLLGTASEKRFEMLKSQPYNYDFLVDYHNADWVDKIVESADGRGAQFVLDCISEGDSVKKVSQTLCQGGQMAIVRSRAGKAWKADDLPLEPIYGAVWEGLGEEIQYRGFRVPKSLDARAFAVDFFRWLSNTEVLEPNPVRLMPGGLERIVPDGFTLLGSNLMGDRKSQAGQNEPWMKPLSGDKLVYTVSY
ncbi:MAG: hypothetical protein M1820_003196 [Bogoriella megaspora]|nr:MAG: hypothetical protein M1820_003196 [Bogoriella megaspora]